MYQGCDGADGDARSPCRRLGRGPSGSETSQTKSPVRPLWLRLRPALQPRSSRRQVQPKRPQVRARPCQPPSSARCSAFSAASSPRVCGGDACRPDAAGTPPRPISSPGRPAGPIGSAQDPGRRTSAEPATRAGVNPLECRRLRAAGEGRSTAQDGRHDGPDDGCDASAHVRTSGGVRGRSFGQGTSRSSGSGSTTLRPCASRPGTSTR